MKIKLFLTAIVFAIASFSFSQSTQAVSMSDQVKEEAMELTSEMTSYLDLTENQVNRMEGLNMLLMKNKAQLKESNLSEEELAKKLNVIEERHNSTVKQVLSEEQYTKFQSKYSEGKMKKKDKSMN